MKNKARDYAIVVGMGLGIAAVIAALAYYEVSMYQECMGIGHSFLYCFRVLGN